MYTKECISILAFNASPPLTAVMVDVCCYIRVSEATYCFAQFSGTKAFFLAVAHLSAREAYQATMAAAAAAAVRRGGEEMLVTDLPREVLQSAEGGNPGQGWLH